MAAAPATKYGERVTTDRQNDGLATTSGASDRRERWARWARWSGRRERLRERPVANLVYRYTVAVIGTIVLFVGIIAIPYPGPGWAIVFLGLGILATEFVWAQRLLKFVKRRYDASMAWFREQHILVQCLGGVFTCVVVVLTLWLLGAVGWVAVLVGIDWPWLKSPIGVGA